MILISELGFNLHGEAAVASFSSLLLWYLISSIIIPAYITARVFHPYDIIKYITTREQTHLQPAGIGKVKQRSNDTQAVQHAQTKLA